MADVVTWNSAEADAEKIPTVYQDFEYNTESNGGCLTKLDEVNAIIKTIHNDVGDIGAKYRELQSLYNTFTDYNEVMNSNRMLLEQSISEITDAYTQIVDGLQLQIQRLQESSGELLEDLDSINTMLNNGGDTATDDQTTPVDTTPTDTTPEDDTSTTPTTPTTPTATDLASVAADVIAGKYGSGPARKAALAAAGYDPDEVQKIVNGIINGTYTGDISSVTPTVPTTPTTDTPVVPTTPATPATDPTTGGTEAGFMPSVVSDKVSSFINAARSYIGTKYGHGDGNGSMDCSDLVSIASRAVGLNLPDYTGSLRQLGTHVDRANVQPGDLIFTNGGQHVQIVTGVNADGSIATVGASSKAGYVKDCTVNSGIVDIRRVIV